MASDSDEEDSFVTYGTPVEILDEDAPRKKPTLIEDQVVTDKQGRRRFHGAFSGGFSAGYFNTVGSEKGWMPSTFVSSRSQKQQRKEQRPEDFMDDDDLGEYGIAPRKITTTDTYDQLDKSDGSKKRGWRDVDGGVIPGHAPLQDLIQPTSESIGIRLLRKMGWRHGQGIGPRQKKKRAAKKVYGCSMPQVTNDESSEDEFAQGYFFAPKDVDSFKFQAKDDLHGIGYRGIDARTAMYDGHEHINLFENKSIEAKSSSGKFGIRGMAFGVGAFEDQDDDIYSTDHMSNYDQFIGDEILSAKPKQKSKFASNVSKLLQGFMLSANSRPPNKIYPPPDIPRDFKAYHDMSNVQAAGPKFTSKLFTMSAIQRGALLGEEQLLAPENKPVSKNLAVAPSKPTVMTPQQTLKQSEPTTTASAESQVDIAAAVASLVSTQRAKMESRFAKPSEPNVPETNPLPRPTADSGSLGFQPFSKDPAKQKRYEEFLSNKGKSFDSVATEGMTEWERRREHDEFTRASILYKPLSNTMASRFTTAKHADDDDSKVDVPADQQSEKGEQAKAAEMKMFGRLTRNTFEWHPDRLLCKRFNIPDPYPGSSIIGVPTVKKDKASIYNFISIPSKEESHTYAKQQPTEPQKEQQTVTNVHQTKTLPIVQSGGLFSNFKPAKKDTMIKEPSNKKSEGNELVEEKRPPMDLFKAIFQDESTDDSDESSDEEDEEKVNENEAEQKEEDAKNDQLVKGSDQISEVFPGATTDDSVAKDISSKQYKVPDINVVQNTYGPALPPPTTECAMSSSNTNKDKEERHLFVSKEERHSKRNKDYEKEGSSRKTKKHSDHHTLEKKHKHRKKEKHKRKHKKEKKPKKSKEKSKHKRSRGRTQHGSDSEQDSSSEDYSSED